MYKFLCLSFIVAFCPLVLMAQPETEVSQQTETQEAEVFSEVQVMPRFPGCEDAGLSEPETKACAERKMLEFIYTQIQYPQEARENGLQGMVVVQFLVTASGALENPVIMQEPGGGTGEEVLRLVGLMPNWIPGKLDGKPVPVKFTFPVRFKLESSGPIMKKGKKKRN
ncbi:MAG: energy transducer TonB [Bacteroidota bacterium]